MNLGRILSTSIVVSFFALGLRAEYKKITFFGQAEYLTYSDAFEKAENSFNQMVNKTAADTAGFGTVTSNVKTSGGAGFRIGAFAPSPLKTLMVGGSLGYVAGPSFKGEEKIQYDDESHYNTTSEDTAKLWRYMGETKYSVPLGNKFQARLAFALGIAALKVKHKVTVDDSDAPGPVTTDHSISTMKLSWEIGPAIAYVTDRIGVELALTYAQMPSAENSNTFKQFDWNPFGVRLGVEF